MPQRRFRLQPTKPLTISHISPFRSPTKEPCVPGPVCAALAARCHQSPSPSSVSGGTGFHHAGIIARFGRLGSQNLPSHICEISHDGQTICPAHAASELINTLSRIREPRSGDHCVMGVGPVSGHGTCRRSSEDPRIEENRRRHAVYLAARFQCALSLKLLMLAMLSMLACQRWLVNALTWSLDLTVDKDNEFNKTAL